MPRRGINGGPGRTTAYTDLHGWRKCKKMVGNNLCLVGCLRLAALLTKIDGINFEQHVFCGGPKGELHGCSE